MKTEIKYYIQRNLASSDYSIYKFKKTETEISYWDVKKEEWSEPVKRGFMYNVNPTPVLTVEHEMMQSFIEEIMNMGFSPSSMAQSKGELVATKEHLKDMRKLVFKDLAEYK